MGNDNNGVLRSQFGDEFLDLCGGYGIKGRTWLIHKNDFGAYRYGPRDAKPLLLPSREAGSGFRQPVLDLLPEAGFLQ